MALITDPATPRRSRLRSSPVIADMAQQLASPVVSAPTAPARPKFQVGPSLRPNFTMPPAGPEPYVAPAQLGAPVPGTAVGPSLRPNWTASGPVASAVRNNVGATEATYAAAPNSGPQMPGGMRPNAGPGMPGGMRPNAGPVYPGPATPAPQWPFAAKPAVPVAPKEMPRVGTMKRMWDATKGAPSAAAGAVSSGANSLRSNVGAAANTVRGMATEPGRVLDATASALRSPTGMAYTRAGGVAAAGIPDALDVGKVLANPGTSGIDVATQAAEGTGRLASAGAGAMGGATLGGAVGGPLAPLTAAAGAVIGGGIGYFAGDKAIRGLRNMVGADPRSPIETMPPIPPAPVPTPAVPAPTTPTTVPGRGEGQVLNGPVAPSVNPAYPAGPNVYSDGSDSGPIPGKDPSYRPQGGVVKDQGDSILRGSGDVSVVGSIGVDGYNRQLANLRALDGGGSGGGGGAAGIGTGRNSLRDTANAQDLGPNIDQRMALSTGSTHQRAAAAKAMSDMALTQTREQGENRRASMHAGVARESNNNSLRVAEMNNATQRENNAATTSVALRGHELDYQGRMAPMRLAQQQRETAQKFLSQTQGADGKGQPDPAAAHAAMVQAGLGDTPAAKALAEGVTTQLAQRAAGDKVVDDRMKATRSLFDGQGHKFIDQGAMSSLSPEERGKAAKAAEDDAHNWAMSTVPGFANADKETQRRVAPRIAAMYEVHLKTQEPDHTGNFGGLRTLLNKPADAQPTNQQRPREFFRGGSVGSRYGAIDGALTWGYENGDVDYKPANGNSLRIRNPSAEALAALRALSAGKNPLDD